ncbi:hypothetical protein [Edaphobacter bradus]|uniref:hypothetical protein n=1 Tax=Edaphobacter bradus TaxID=2259016 RepID=UPI0021E0F774|nr:hypothetical protein [Edaphobacter bradus]
MPVTFEQPLHNASYPELVYWFITPETFAPGQAAHDVQHIAKDSRFTFAFLTERNGVNFSAMFPPNDFVPPSCPHWPPWCNKFSGNAKSHALLANIVKDAHANGLKLGTAFNWLTVDTEQKISFNEAQTVVSSAETTLDDRGHATLTVGAKLRFAPPLKSELLRVYVFTKTADGEYDPRTLEDVTTKAHGVARIGDPTTGLMDVTIDLGPRYAGKTVVAMQQTWLNALDLQNDAYIRWVHNALDEYRDVPLDGTALDEFGYTRLLGNPPWRGLFAGEAFQARFEASTGMKLPETLLAMRYSPSGHPEVRIRAIDKYWDFLRTGPQRIEMEFNNYSKKVFGETTFAGIHNTIHNHLTNDEPWTSGLNWWIIPRQYGMSDENLSISLRMGMLVSHPGNIMYDQFYGRDIHMFAEKALYDARFNARIHYHGYNDVGAWGVDLSTEPLLKTINPIEEKIRLLNRFDPAAPELPLLVVFGMPRLLNWYPREADRNSFDVNGSLLIEEKAKALWDAGFRCAVVPSDLIDNGMLRLDDHGVPVIHGHRFRAIVYLYPEYAKRSTLSFLEAYVQHGGALMLEGTATRDFDGEPIADRFSSIAAKARVNSFDIANLDKLAITKDPLQKIGGSLEDGSVILTDLASIEKHTPNDFSVTVGGHNFRGSYEGVFAIKTTKDGTIEKLACGQCGPLSRDGREILRLQKPADLFIRNDVGGYRAVVVGDQGSNSVHMTK